ncbi:MAG: hypothetical protein OEZ33_10630 [Gammaproteobacteria bacterium]|nr:hypothetical protein [Gammaproteobacteria bacterium]MDH5778660.1 hypothetical protein [Gammaproteobacteria bacterium]
MLNSLKQYLLGLGPLRWMLHSGGLVIILFRPAPGTEVAFEGAAVFQTLLLPTLAPIVFMVLMLDALMTRILLNDKDEAEQIRMRRALRTDLAIGIALLLLWYPYFSHLLVA